MDGKITTVRVDGKTRAMLFEVKIQMMEERRKNGMYTEPTMDEIICRIADMYLKNIQRRAGSVGQDACRVSLRPVTPCPVVLAGAHCVVNPPVACQSVWPAFTELAAEARLPEYDERPDHRRATGISARQFLERAAGSGAGASGKWRCNPCREGGGRRRSGPAPYPYVRRKSRMPSLDLSAHHMLREKNGLRSPKSTRAGVNFMVALTGAVRLCIAARRLCGDMLTE